MITKITPNLYLITLPHPKSYLQANVYLIKNENLLIDVGIGNYQTFCQLKSSVKKLGKQINELSIILTHHHPDHVGLLKYFPSKTTIFADPKIQYYGSNDYLKAIENQNKAFENLEIPLHVIRKVQAHLKKRYLPFLTNFNFQDPHKISVSGLRVYSFSGHSSSDLVIQKNHCFFGGDLFLKGIYFNSLLDIDPNTQKLNSITNQYNQTTKWIINNFNIDTWFPGHGKSMNLTQLIKIQQKYRKLYAEVHQQIPQNFKFYNYDRSITKIYRHFPKVDDYFYLSDLLSEGNLLNY